MKFALASEIFSPLFLRGDWAVHQKAHEATPRIWERVEQEKPNRLLHPVFYTRFVSRRVFRG